MREFQQKQKMKRMIYSRVSLVILIFIFVIISRATWNVYTKERETGKKAETAQIELAELRDRKEALTANIAKLQSEEGIEQQIRENFHMAKPGENLVVFVNDATQTPAEPEGVISGLWRHIKGVFK